MPLHKRGIGVGTGMGVGWGGDEPIPKARSSSKRHKGQSRCFAEYSITDKNFFPPLLHLGINEDLMLERSEICMHA